jgi:hypothetical protein
MTKFKKNSEGSQLAPADDSSQTKRQQPAKTPDQINKIKLRKAISNRPDFGMELYDYDYEYSADISAGRGRPAEHNSKR